MRFILLFLHSLVLVPKRGLLWCSSDEATLVVHLSLLVVLVEDELKVLESLFLFALLVSLSKEFCLLSYGNVVLGLCFGHLLSQLCNLLCSYCLLRLSVASVEHEKAGSAFATYIKDVG